MAKPTGKRFWSLSVLVLMLSVFPALSDITARFQRPLTIPFPDDRPYDPQIATLGKMIFFDPRISGAQNMSCASCHNPSFGWKSLLMGRWER